MRELSVDEVCFVSGGIIDETGQRYRRLPNGQAVTQFGSAWDTVGDIASAIADFLGIGSFFGLGQGNHTWQMNTSSVWGSETLADGSTIYYGAVGDVNTTYIDDDSNGTIDSFYSYDGVSGITTIGTAQGVLIYNE